MHFCLTRTTFVKFAYRLAVVNSITVPDSWKKNQSTGKHWLNFFFKRIEHVNKFFDNLEQVMAQLGKNYSPSNIYILIVKKSLFFCQKNSTNHSKITLYYNVK